MKEDINDYFNKNYKLIENISKRVLKDRFREGISSYYIHLYEKNGVPLNIATNAWYFMTNLSKPQSEINYVPVTLKGTIHSKKVFEEQHHQKWNQIDIIDLKIDLEDERLIDFLLNNEQNQLWISIYEVFFEKRLQFDIFEEVIFDYVFNQGLSIRDISRLTNNSPSWIYKQRKSVIDKIKLYINEKKM